MIMAMPILNSYRNKIHTESIENLIKAEALIDAVLFNSNISEIPIHTIHDYFWALSDFIKQAKRAHERLSPML